MAAKSLREAVLNALLSQGVYLSSSQMKMVEFEVRDWAAHRTMILDEAATANDLFKDLFGHIPVFKENE